VTPTALLYKYKMPAIAAVVAISVINAISVQQPRKEL
jgi:hypothetical protein